MTAFSAKQSRTVAPCRTCSGRLLAEKAGFELYGPLLLAVDALADSPAKQHLLDLVYALQNTSASISDLRGAIALYDNPADLLAHYAASPLA